MRLLRFLFPVLLVCTTLVRTAGVGAQVQSGPEKDHLQTVDWPMVAKIREEGLRNSHLAETLSFMTDVLGARLTLSEDMRKAQVWAMAELERMGLTNTVIEPFMDYGVSWDNEYVSLHLLEPDYQPMVGYPLAHTPGSDGRQVLDVVIADPRTVQDLEQFRGRLAGVAVLSTPPGRGATAFAEPAARAPQPGPPWIRGSDGVLQGGGRGCGVGMHQWVDRSSPWLCSPGHGS